jgi:hypothetical protein
MTTVFSYELYLFNLPAPNHTSRRGVARRGLNSDQKIIQMLILVTRFVIVIMLQSTLKYALLTLHITYIF